MQKLSTFEFGSVGKSRKRKSSQIFILISNFLPQGKYEFIVSSDWQMGPSPQCARFIEARNVLQEPHVNDLGFNTGLN